MRLFQINVTANQGSTGRIAEQIGQLVISRGWESTIAYGRGTPVSASNLIRIGSETDKRWHGVETRLLDNHGLASRRATRRLVTEIEKSRPSIIHLHNIHGYYVNYEILFGYLAQQNIPVVWTLHDCWTMTGHCSHFENSGCMRWLTECHDCPERGSYPASLLRDASRSNYIRKKAAFTSLKNLTIVTPSQWLADIVKRSYLKDYQVKVIHNGIDLDVFKPGKAKRHGLIIGVASVWTERKGLKDFIELRKLLSPNDYEITLVGLTPSQVKNLPEGITGICHTENLQQLVDLYSSASVFVNPTYEDTFPTTNIEALACGTPVVTYSTGGSPEIIDRITGRVVDKGDIGALADAVKEICQLSVSQSQDVYNKCRLRAESNFDCRERFEEYLMLYDNLLGKTNK